MKEPVVRRCSVKKLFFEIAQNSHKTPVQESLFIWSSRPQAYNFIKKETLSQVFSCEFGTIYNNTFYYRTSLVAASDMSCIIYLFHLILEHNLGINFYQQTTSPNKLQSRWKKKKILNVLQKSCS